jgi:predicted metal-dependent hydrolase
LREDDAVTDAELFERGRELFNRGRFFEAHEEWEKIWLHAHGPRRLFLQGLIQIAAGCHKAYERGDRRGCAALVAAGLEKICRGGLPAELAGFSDLCDRLIALMRLRETGPTELPSAPLLPASPAGPAPTVSGGTPEGLTPA